MVDFRPLLFINALALMLLVTAGYASIQLPDYSATQPTAAQQDGAEQRHTGTAVATEKTEVTASTEPESPADSTAYLEPELTDAITTGPLGPEQWPGPEPAAKSEQQLATLDAGKHDPFASEQNASARPEREPGAQEAVDAAREIPDRIEQPSEPAAPPTTAKLTLRSNVYGDQVTVNGEPQGSTRLNLELEPGKYDIVISKNGFRPWQKNVQVKAEDDLTLRGRLEAYTRVNYTDGSWVGGVKTGEGTYSDDTGLRYEGAFVDGRFHGTGTAWYADGGRYEGDWQEGKRAGEGTYRGPDDATYTGQFVEDQFHGQGTLTRANGDILTGTWAGSQLNGHGSLTTADGLLYVGGFRNDRFHGEGSVTEPGGTSYEGEFSNGKYHGRGSEVLADGKKYQGEYVEGKFHGKGLLLNPNGSSIESTFRHGEPYGQVKLTTPEGEVFRARTSEPGVCYRDKSYRATQCPPLDGW